MTELAEQDDLTIANGTNCISYTYDSSQVTHEPDACYMSCASPDTYFTWQCTAINHAIDIPGIILGPTAAPALRLTSYGASHQPRTSQAARSHETHICGMHHPECPACPGPSTSSWPVPAPLPCRRHPDH